MLRKIATTLALAVGLGTAGLVLSPTTADARPFIWFPHPHMGMGIEHVHQDRFFHHGFFHHGPFFGPQIFLGPPIVFEQEQVFSPGPCYWLGVKARRTGSPYWFNRWHACRLQVYGVF